MTRRKGTEGERKRAKGMCLRMAEGWETCHIDGKVKTVCERDSQAYL